MYVKPFFLYKIFRSMVKKQKLHTTVVYNAIFGYPCTHTYGEREREQKATATTILFSITITSFLSVEKIFKIFSQELLSPTTG